MAYAPLLALPQGAYNPAMFQFPGLDPQQIAGGMFSEPVPIGSSIGTIPDVTKIPSFNLGGSNNNQFGFNIPTIGLGLQALNSIAGLYGGLKSLSLAKKSFNFQRDFANANLANQIQSYNTALSDRSRSRARVEGQTPEEAQAYVQQNSLTSRRI